MNTTDHRNTPARTAHAHVLNDDATASRAISTIARQAMEIHNGYRAATTLSPFLVLEEQRRLHRRISLVSEHRKQRGIAVSARVHVNSTRICRVSDDVIESTSVVRDSLRTRFICMRWERRRGHWRITALDFG